MWNVGEYYERPEFVYQTCQSTDMRTRLTLQTWRNISQEPLMVELVGPESGYIVQTKISDRQQDWEEYKQVRAHYSLGKSQGNKRT